VCVAVRDAVSTLIQRSSACLCVAACVGVRVGVCVGVCVAVCVIVCTHADVLCVCA